MKQRKLLFLLALLTLPIAPTLASPTESASDLLNQIPFLPDKIDNAECSHAKATSQRAEEIAARQFTEQAYASMTQISYAAAVTDEQGDALTRLTDESINQCIMDISMTQQELVNQYQQNLQQDITALEEHKVREDGRCGSGIGMDINCHNSVIRKHKQNVITRSNTFLKNVGAPFSQWRNQAAECIQQRDAAANAVLRTGMKGPFTIQAQGIITQNYSLVKAVADAYYELCNAAVMATQDTNY